MATQSPQSRSSTAGHSRAAGAGRTKVPTQAQRRYLERGLGQPGGKLPLFDADGQEIPRKTIESCVQNGWAAPWFHNPVKPDWLVCRLTECGFEALAAGRSVTVPQ